MAFVAPIVAAVQAAAPVISAVGTGLSVLGTLQSATARSQTAQSQADYSQYNAAVSRNNAIQARQAAEADAATIRDRTRREMGTSRASRGASGLVASAGSALLTEQEQALQGELSASRRLYSGELQASGYTSQAALDSAQAQAFRQQSRNIQQEGLLTGIATGVSGTYDILK